jgi:uncharacterized protein (PEP-CTERM system associated)
MQHPAAKNRRSERRTLRVSAAGRVVAAIAVGCVQSAVAQTLPSGAGYQIGDGSIPVVAPKRGVQGWATEASFTAQATLTNNANYGESSVRAGDLVLEFIPALNFNRQGGRLKVDGYIALDMLAYVDGTQASSILPRANILANLEAIDNLFFVDASLFAGQSVENPFLPRSAYSSTNNLYTSTQARLAPYFKGSVGQYVTWLVRSDVSYTWTSQSDNPTGNAFYVRNVAEVVRAPTPLGLTLRLTNDLTRIQDQVQPDQTLNTALGIVDYAFTPQFTFGLRGGYETTTYTAEEVAGPIYGANLAWKPSPLTNLIGYWEQRFYGPSYQFEASHRQRRLASSASFYRTITTYPQVLLQIPATNSVTGLLNAILVARFPDPIERAGAVQDLVTRQGLPQSLPAGAYIYNQSANILTGGNANWALIGTRNTLSLNLFYLKTELLPDASIPPTFLAFNNNIQQGGGVTLSHTLSPVISLNGTLSTQYTKGFGPSEGLNTRQGLASVQTNWQMSPRSTLFVGTRYQYQNSGSPALADTVSSEFAIFTGLFHRL